MGTHPEIGRDSGIADLPIEILENILSHFLSMSDSFPLPPIFLSVSYFAFSFSEPKKYVFTGDTTPWNLEAPYDNSSGWCMTIDVDPITKVVSGTRAQ